MNALPFAPRRRGTALLTVLLTLARAAGDAKGPRTAGSGKAPGSGTGDGAGAGDSGTGR